MKIEFALRKLIPKLKLNQIGWLVKIYETYATLRYAKKFEEELIFRGSKFVIGRDTTLFPQVYLGIFENSELDFLLNLPQSDDCIFWDVGANVGIYSVLFANKFPKSKIYAFEPNHEVLQLLEKNLGLNGSLNVEIINLALADTTGSRYLASNVKRNGAASLLNAQKSKISKQVSCITGDDFAERLSWNYPDIIKIDVEGFEPEVIFGCREIINENKPSIFLEIFPKLWTPNRLDVWQQMLNELFSIYGSATLIHNGKIRQIMAINVAELSNDLKTLVFG